MFTVDDYYNEIPQYKNLETAQFKKVFDFLIEPESLMKMFVANDAFKAAALDGVVNDLELKFPALFQKDVEKNCVGSMIQFIMEQFGYELEQNEIPIKNSQLFTKASRYNKVSNGNYVLENTIRKVNVSVLREFLKKELKD
ncbi:MAG: hypothetical protein PWQ84_1990 [Thermotogaceae bacterium]|nr:hypothetical protein [Thermotogaceae bacterium]